MISATFVDCHELSVMNLREIHDEERFLLIAFPVFICRIEETGRGTWDWVWKQRFHLMPIFAQSLFAPSRTFYLGLDDETSQEGAWASIPDKTNTYARLDMTPFNPQSAKQEE